MGGAANQRADLELILADGTTYPQRGQIDIIGRDVSPSTGTLRIRGLFANPGNVLRPGQYAKIRAATSVRNGALLLPQGAVEELQGGYQVMVVGPANKCQVRAVVPGDRIGAYWVIEQGLKPSDQVVIEGLQKVQAGTAVTPKPAKLPPFKTE